MTSSHDDLDINETLAGRPATYHGRMTTMLIDIHMLQNYAPSNLNRDDTGAPKDAIFGNALRARISSQAIKRAIRRSDIFADAFRDQDLLANRTRRLPHLIREQLQGSGLDPEAIDLIVMRSREIGRESGREIAAADARAIPRRRNSSSWATARSDTGREAG